MSKKLAKSISSVCIIIGLSLSYGCGTRMNTAEALALALKNEGLNYKVIESIDTSDIKYAKIDEAIALKGANLHIKIFRIEDEKTYKFFAGTLGLVAVFKEKFGKKTLETPKNAFLKKPFVIVIKNEPCKGIVKQTLQKFFPE